MKPLRVLVIEDDALVARAWTRILRREGHLVLAAASLGAARTRLEQARDDGAIDLVLLDLRLPDGDGRALLRELDDLAPDATVVAVTGAFDAATAVSLHGQVDVVLPKPLDHAVLLEVTKRLVAAGNVTDHVERFATDHRLSPAETRLLMEAAQGADTGQAAARLGCRPGTVTTHWKRIFGKTGIRSKRQLLARVLHYCLAKPRWRQPSGVRAVAPPLNVARRSQR